jgi:hypothetical protein
MKFPLCKRNKSIGFVGVQRGKGIVNFASALISTVKIDNDIDVQIIVMENTTAVSKLLMKQLK